MKSLGYIHGKQLFDAKLNEDVAFGYHAVSIDEKRAKFPVSLWDESRKKTGQVIEQVWFSGVHSDVGGGYAQQDLSDISFGWMMDKAEACGLELKDNWDKNLSSNFKGDKHESLTWYWSLLGSAEREIPKGARIHQSVFDRSQADLPKEQKSKLPENSIPVKNTSYKPKPLPD